MPLKLQSEKRPRESSSAAATEAGFSPRRTPPDVQREYATLRLFLTQPGGFRFAFATFTRPAARDGLNSCLVKDLDASQVQFTVLDLASGSGSLLLALQDHLAANPAPTGVRQAVSVINIETRLSHSDVTASRGEVGARDLGFLEEANFHRDAFPSACQCPLLLWLPALYEPDLAKQAPDLWHWRSARFDFEREGLFLDDFRAHPAKRAAWFEQIALASHRLGDARGEAIDLINLGTAKLEMGDANGAIQHFESALTKSREIGDRRAEATAIGNIGVVHGRLSDYKMAKKLFEQALAISREIGDKRLEGQVLIPLGDACSSLGEWHAELEFFEMALKNARDVGDRRLESVALESLGFSYGRMGEARKAMEFHEQALAIAQQLRDKSTEGQIVGNIARAYIESGNVNKAIELLEQALKIFRETGNCHDEGTTIGILGIAYAALGDTRKAMELYKQDLEIEKQVGNRYGQGCTLFNWATASERLGDHAQAISSAEEALKIFKEIDDPEARRVEEALAKWRSAIKV